MDSLQARPSPLVLADWMAELGQDLFDPPNVGGWPGGQAWLSSQRMIARIRFAEAMVSGELSSPWDPQPITLQGRPGDHPGGPQQIERRESGNGLVQDLSRLLLGRSLGKDGRAALFSAASTSNSGEFPFISTLWSWHSASSGGAWPKTELKVSITGRPALYSWQALASPPGFTVGRRV